VTRLLLIRHGDTDAVDRYIAGNAPGTPLNDAGRAQVAALVARLHDVPLTAVVSSPLERTRQTADPLARDHGLDLEIAPALTELDFGSWTGATFASLASDAAWSRFNTLRSLTRAPRGELMLDVQRRAVSAAIDIRDRHPDGTVAVVSHGDVIRALLLFLLGMPMDFYSRVEIEPARISVVELHADAPRVLLVNGDSARGVV
jgi:probable phosphomutase (TIGR03848 family)